MVSQNNVNGEIYNLRWNSYFPNLLSGFTEHQNQESLVDVTIGCEGQFIKAHKLILSACSGYFQNIFHSHSSSQLLILLNDVKFEHLKLVVQFMYKGEVKVCDTAMPEFLQLGKMLQVKGLCSVELENKQKEIIEKTKVKPIETRQETSSPESGTSGKAGHTVKLVTIPKKRKLTVSPSLSSPKRPNEAVTPPEKINNPAPIPLIPRPPSAFMIFANQWRKKLAVDYPNESNKDISVRLSNMWKALSQENKDAFYEDARRAEEDHKAKYSEYFEGLKETKEAKHRKTIVCVAKRHGASILTTEPKLIKIKCEGVAPETDPLDISTHN